MSGEVARTILEQLGGRSFGAMVGIGQVVDLGDGVQFAVGGGSTRSLGGINKVVVKLAADDTYDLSFWRIRGVEVREIHAYRGVHAHEMRGIVEIATGLRTSL